MRARIVQFAAWVLLICGTAPGQFATQNVTFQSNLPLSTIGGGEGADIWGWTDPLTDKDYALFARTNGTAFIDVTDGENPVYLGNLPSHTGTSVWRDVKVYEDHAFIVSDSNGPHGMQVFDLTNLRGVTSPQTFAETAHTSSFRSAHNVAINEDSGYAYVVGSNRAGGGLHIIDIQDPTNPVTAGGFSADGYTHDVQVVNYIGPDASYAGRELAFASNEDTLTIVDVTNKNSPSLVHREGYPQSGYTHQGWLSEDHRYFFLNDEFDEFNTGSRTRTHVFDVSNLDNPQYVGFHTGTTNAVDHNLYVMGDYIFQANYRAGVRILEIEDASQADLEEVGYLDTYPGSNSAGFNGAWSVYPYFDGGKFIASDIERGLFVAVFDPLAVTFADCDFDQDGDCDVADVDSMYPEFGGSDPKFDLDGNGVVDNDDLTEWLAQASSNSPDGKTFVRGDATLDGNVLGGDFSILASNFGQPGVWSDGNFVVDPVPGGGTVGGQDFSLLASNFNFTSIASVPEPAGLSVVAALGWLSMLAMGRASKDQG